MANSEKYLPYIVSLLLPGLNILSNSHFYNDFHWYAIAPKWFVVSIFLFGLWKLLEVLILIPNKSIRWLSVIMGPMVFISLFLLAEHYFFPSYIQLNEVVPVWAVGIRLILGTLLFLTIILSFQTAKEREKLRVENISLQSENLKAQLNQLKQQLNPISYSTV